MEYMGDFPDLPAGNIVVRVLLLLWTGDYPAQCEVGKFIKGGILPCRRDKLKGEKQRTTLFLFIHCITPVDVHISYKFLITKVLHVHVAGHFSTQQKLL